MDKFICEYCNNEYKSTNSRINHYKTKHLDEYIEKKNKKLEKKLNCSTCDKKLSDRSSKYRHEQLCNKKTKIIELKNELKILTDKMDILLNSENKIESKKLQNINKNNTINKINTNNAPINNTTNNGTVNNTTNIINIVNYGDENLSKILQSGEILQLLAEYKQRAVEESIKAVHFNDDRPEYKNIYITCLDSDIIYVYNEIAKDFVEASQKEVINKLIDKHCNCIVKTIEEFKSEINIHDYNRIQDFINRIYFGDTEFKHRNFKEPFPTFRDYKIASIKLIIYKNSDKINKK
jgi:hypothetical protein